MSGRQPTSTRERAGQPALFRCAATTGDTAGDSDTSATTSADANLQVVESRVADAHPVEVHSGHDRVGRNARGWRTGYQLAALLVDLGAALCAVVGAFLVRFGYAVSEVRPSRLALLAVVLIAWLAAVGLNRGYEVRILGAGTSEFERLGKAFLELTALTTFTAYATHADPSRGFVLSALPATLVLSAAGRYTLRKIVHGARRRGRAIVNVLAVGGVDEIESFSDNLARNADTGLRVRAACLVSAVTPDAADAARLESRGISLTGDCDSIRDAVIKSGISTVAVVANDIGSEKLRWISWQLEGTDADLVLLPALTEVAGRRLSIEQVGALPLLYVSRPEFTGLRRAVKAGFDRLLALIALILLAPVLILVALAIRVTSRGPALFAQTRVGKDGTTFRMIKFRSMVVDAEALTGQLETLNEVPGGTLFKIRRDPRVTRVGRFLRRFSIDEIPQLINVLTGRMSLVGPRPPLPQEVATYGGDVRRRLLVKPGLTGLWQISGRSDLTWEESVRLDLRYVENWSLTLDALVLLRTFSAVVRGRGAY
jgi:exopolysaccharide biosynthesis polyprenyl glycosylphosphotransferase